MQRELAMPYLNLDGIRDANVGISTGRVDAEHLHLGVQRKMAILYHGNQRWVCRKDTDHSQLRKKG